MAKTRQAVATQAGQRSAQLLALQRRFGQFRASHGRGARVPAALRAAVVAAVESGVTWKELQQACGVSWGQVACWRTQGRGRGAVADEVEEVRAFSVVEDRAVGEDAAGQELTLRLGPWSVTVRVSEEWRGRGAGPCCR